MNATVPRAKYAVLPLQIASSRVLLVGGVVVLAASLALTPSRWAAVVGGLVGAVVVVLLGWLFLRGRLGRRLDSMYARAPVADGSARRTTARATRNGLLIGLASLAAGAVVLALENLALDLDSPGALGGTLALGFGLTQTWSARRLRQWQDARDLEVCTLEGAPYFAWTARQAGGRLVVVPLTGRAT